MNHERAQMSASRMGWVLTVIYLAKKTQKLGRNNDIAEGYSAMLVVHSG